MGPSGPGVPAPVGVPGGLAGPGVPGALGGLLFKEIPGQTRIIGPAGFSGLHPYTFDFHIGTERVETTPGRKIPIGVVRPQVQTVQPVKVPAAVVRPQVQPVQLTGQPFDVQRLGKELHATTYFTWLQQTGVTQLINDGGFYTILVPTDDAIAGLPRDYLARLQSSQEQLRQLLIFHIIPGHITTTVEEQVFQTLDPQAVLRVNSYQGGKLFTISGSQVLSRKQEGNFIFFTLDKLITRPVGSLLDTINSSPYLRQLASAVKFAGLEDYLAGEGPYTFFAPSDEAFKNYVGRDNLLRDRQALKDMLLRHLVPKTLYSVSIQERQTVRSLGGLELKFSIVPECVTVNGINVNNVDNGASNGVLHIIDHFL